LLVSAHVWLPKDSSVALDDHSMKAVAPPTIELPSKPVDATSEKLREELLQLGETMLARFPQVPEALHVVALSYADLQRTREAEKIWRNCLPLAPRQAGPYVGLARAAMELGKDQEAVDTLRQALSAGCSTPDVYRQLAAALTKLGMLDEAAQVVQEGLQEFPQDAENWLQLGQIQNQLGQFAAAETSLKQGITAGLTSERVYFALATACERQGKSEEAATYRQEFTDRRAVRESSIDTRFQTRYDVEMRRIAADSICRAGTVYDQQGDGSQAETLLLRALQLMPDNPVVCNELALFYRRLGRIADALLLQRRLVELDPRHIPHRLNLASLSQQLGDHTAAEGALQQIVQSHPDLAIGYLSLARIHLQDGRSEQARSLAEAALKRRLRDAEEAITAYLVLVAACRQMGDVRAAMEALAKARQLAPNDPRLVRGL
jgi:tetratricopeptide (TPR) repeat protein